MEYMKLLKYHVRLAVLLLFSMSGLKKWETCLWFSAINFIFWTKIFLIVFEFHQIICTSSLYRLFFRPLQIFLDCCSVKKLFLKILQIYKVSKLDCVNVLLGKILVVLQSFTWWKVETMIYYVNCHANSWISWLWFLQFQVDF